MKIIEYLSSEHKNDKNHTCDALREVRLPLRGLLYFDLFFALYRTNSGNTELYSVLPRTIYKPHISTARHEVQSSCFIYQLGIKDGWQNADGNDVRRIKIAGDAKARVLKELEDLGVNRATVCADFDSIAKYVMGDKLGVSQSAEIIELRNEIKNIRKAHKAEIDELKAEIAEIKEPATGTDVSSTK
jgi:hypothetical protein